MKRVRCVAHAPHPSSATGLTSHTAHRQHRWKAFVVTRRVRATFPIIVIFYIIPFNTTAVSLLLSVLLPLCFVQFHSSDNIPYSLLCNYLMNGTGR